MASPIVRVPVSGALRAETVFVGWAAKHPHSFWLDADPSDEATDGSSWVGIGDEVSADDVLHVPVGAGDEVGTPADGWVGWFDYDTAAGRAGRSAAGVAADSRWMRVRVAVHFEHSTGAVTVHGSASEAAKVHDAVQQLVPVDPPPAPEPTTAHPRVTPSAYAELIAQCRDEIARGNAYQLCLTTRFSVDTPIDAGDTYRRLRRGVPAHRGALIHIGDTAVLSASPEQFLAIEGAHVRTHPIKGTRPRGSEPQHDALLATQLRNDVKERAENVMIVDLMRNDLSRVCETGSVRVDKLFAVETYTAVHQLVSVVSGTLRPHLNLADVLRATFPAGSMTGAPKLSAMQILARLEGAPRGIFAGCCGWVGSGGAVDLMMVIRSIVVGPHNAWVGAGGGITWLSRAEQEIDEVGIKASGPLAAIGATVPAGWMRRAGKSANPVA